MAQTLIRGAQVLNGSIQRADLDTTTSGQAVVTKIASGTNISISSSGVDPGTGDVTINATVSTGPQGPPGIPAYTNSTAGFTVPGIGSTVTVSVADTSWVTPGETLWVQDAGGAGVAGTMQVQSKTSTSLTLLNAYT